MRSGVLAVLLISIVACTPAPAPPPSTPSPTQPSAPAEHWPTDGWRTADPAAHGIDAASLAALDASLGGAFPHVRSLLVVRDGHLVHEYYRPGIDAGTGHDVRSVTKSVVGTLIGIATADGTLALDSTVGELLPALMPPDADPRLAAVTVEQLLTMTSGLAGDDTSLGGTATVGEALIASPDWLRHILARRLDADPGTRWAYSNATSHLLSAIVATATGRSTLDYARAELFDPLGIDTVGAYEPALTEPLAPATIAAYERSAVAWPVDPQGVHFGSAFLRLPARDLAKLGLLYLHDGRWSDTQLVPSEYVRASTTAHGSGPAVAAGYGRQWWFDDGSFFARGYGGQLIHVVPDLRLVTVVTSDPDAGRNDALDLVTKRVVPAVTP